MTCLHVWYGYLLLQGGCQPTPSLMTSVHLGGMAATGCERLLSTGPEASIFQSSG